MKKILTVVILLAGMNTVYAQKYITRTGKVTFFSETNVENIEAFTNEAASAIDVATGDVVFQVPIKSFKFEKALMQEHFNENYMESSKFPKAEYKGKLTDMSKVDFGKNGTYEVSTKGKLKIHGVTKDVTVPGKITVKGDNVTVNCVFNVAPKDYEINIPGVVAEKIAQKIEVTVNSILDKR